MDCIITPVFEICVTCWDRSAKYRLPIKHFRKSLDNLSVERDRLVAGSHDVKGRVDREKLELHQVPTDEVSGWCTRVEGICNEVDAILEKGEEAAQKNCLGGHCQTNCRSRYKLAKEADDAKQRVMEEVDIGRGFKDVEVTFKPYVPASAVGPQEPTVGMDVNFHKVREWVEDETVRSISMFGVGGVGKTTLLKRVYNHFLRVNPNNHLVLWVVVSQPLNIERIQQKLWKQLNFSDAEWNAFDKEERAIKMQNFLRENNFMLFLDDLWEDIDLAEVGIPRPQPNSKVIFSTRSEEVCGRMQASTSVESNRRMKVECLAPEDALRLFRQKLGEETWTANPQIPKFAETVVKECQYLPLALTTVAKAMVFKREPRQWKEAVEVLRINLAKFQGMQKEVLKILKFSFDALPDERHKNCFLYCSLFPEDFEMGKYDLVDLWIAEGYFDECDNVHHARDRCEDVLDKLTATCLLEQIPFDKLKIGDRFSKGGSFEYYKMHDLVREMALWVAREQYKRKILVLKDQETIALHEFKDAEMISVMQQGARIQDILPTPLPDCLNLSTLILRHVQTDMTRLPSGFFSSMPSLKVLDLCSNEWLSELGGDIGELTSLQYLNIQFTSITELPEEFKKLVNLKYLFLNGRVDMDGVPEEIVSSIIPSLRVFDHFGTSGKLLKLLQDMDVENSEVSISLESASELKQLLTSPGLQSCLRYLFLDLDDLVSITFPKSSVKRMKHFEFLLLNDCPDLEDISICSGKGKEGEENETEEGEEERGVESLILEFPVQDYFHNLRRVLLSECNKLLHLTSLIYHAPNLDTLFMWECESMTEVVRMGDVPESQAVNIFSCLRVLVLSKLPSLKSICGSPLPFPSLRWMACVECDLLRKLPFCADGTQSRYNKLQMIVGEEEWWNRLEWDDVATQQLLAPKFFPIQTLVG